MKAAGSYVDGLLLSGRESERGENHFRALARMSWDQSLVQPFCPLITGQVEKGQSVQVTWLPTQSGTLQYIRLMAPPRTWLYSLVVGGVETVDPREPYPWELFHIQRDEYRIDMPVPFGQTIEMRLGRKSDAES